MSERVEAAEISTVMAGEGAAYPPPDPASQQQLPTSPLSVGQQALWLLHQRDPSSPAHNLAATMRAEQPLDLDALRRALRQVVTRHPQLRTTYAVRDGLLQQRVEPAEPVDLAVIDASGWDDRRFARWYAAFVDRPFDLERGPLLRAALVSDRERGERLVFAAHHIAVDYWSLRLLLDDLSLHYAVESGQTKPGPLPCSRSSYDDFVRWQRELLESPRGERHWEYWQARLAGELPALNLPVDRPHPRANRRGHRARAHHVALDEGLTDQLRSLARTHAATPFMAGLAALFALLYRYTGQEDLIVGVPIAARGRPEFKQLVGFFVNQLPLRITVDPDMPFRELLERVRRAVVGAMMHQDFPYAQMAERLGQRQEPGRSPLHQVSLNWTRALTPQPDDDGRATSPAGRLALDNVEQRGASLELTVGVIESPTSLTVTIQYDADLFDHQTVERMAGHFAVLLAGIVADPKQRVAELPLLTEDERQRLLVDWNRTEADLSADCLVSELFEAQALQQPAETAIVFEDERLTYAELNRRANRLARYLRARGAGPETIVGVALDRSPEQVVAVLAIAKAGAAYLPLDRSLPPARLAFMLEDTGAPIVVSEERLLAGLPAGQRVLVLLDRDRHAIARERADDLGPLASPEHLAYVIYTSGSTGVPKGVLVEHRNLSNFIQSHLRILRQGRESPQLQFATPSFDPSISEIWRPLVAGGELHLARQEVLSSGPALLDLLRERGITHAGLPPALLAVLPDAELPDLRTIVCGGDAASRDVVARWAPGRRFINSYGPTETTVSSCVHVCDAEEPGNPPIGRPTINTCLYVLDQHQQLLPVGVPGELYIGGAGVSRGYLNQPELTAERFVPDPFSQQPGARLYRTGDLARRRPDGNLEFLGRIDQQVKIRGVRVEPGEVEACLRQHPAVREAVVSARGDAAATRQLVAYVTLLPGRDQPTAAQLRRHVARTLPEFMVPSSVVVVAQLPLLPSGKVDRAALPGLVPAASADERDYVPPRTELEATLADIWRAVLGVDRVGIQDDFFELGGASLQVLELVAQADALGIPLTPDMLFVEPTIEQLAAMIDAALAGGDAQPRMTPATR